MPDSIIEKGSMPESMPRKQPSLREKTSDIVRRLFKREKQAQIEPQRVGPEIPGAKPICCVVPSKDGSALFFNGWQLEGGDISNIGDVLEKQESLMYFETNSGSLYRISPAGRDTDGKSEIRIDRRGGPSKSLIAAGEKGISVGDNFNLIVARTIDGELRSLETSRVTKVYVIKTVPSQPILGASRTDIIQRFEESFAVPGNELGPSAGA